MQFYKASALPPKGNGTLNLGFLVCRCLGYFMSLHCARVGPAIFLAMDIKKNKKYVGMNRGQSC